METADSKSADKKRYAISTKAYNDFVDRIRDSLEDMYCWACEDALQLLNAAVEYDNDDPIDIMDCEIEAQVAFLMIKPEIKRAIKRSRAARERAARRKSMAAAEAVASVKNVKSTETVEPVEAVAAAPVIENRDAENTDRSAEETLGTEIGRDEKTSGEIEAVQDTPSTPMLSERERWKTQCSADGRQDSDKSASAVVGALADEGLTLSARVSCMNGEDYCGMQVTS